MPIESSFSGVIDEIPFIYVDNFTDSKKNGYFLSHYHADHTVGLESRLGFALKRNKAYIYASEVTIAIIKADIPQLEPYLKILDIGQNTVKINTDNEEILDVTTIPAGHCFGSIMFIFRYKNKTIMYTGDFRISRNDVSKFTLFHNNDGKPLNLDAMYVDTTFQYSMTFPKRSDVARNIVMHIRNWLNRGNNYNVILFTSANYGYESIFNEIFKATGFKTFIDEKWKVYSQFPTELYGITNSIKESRIFSYSKNSEKYIKIPKNCLKVYLSAWIWQNNVSEDEFFIRSDDGEIIKACFATHCGRDELIYFINYFSPKKVVGFREPYEPIQPINEPIGVSISVGNRSESVIKRKRECKTIESNNKMVKSDIKKAFDW